MSMSTAIGRVSESLQNLLRGEMNPNLGVPVTVLAPDEPGTDPRINLFLYKVRENPHASAIPWQLHPTEAGNLVPPPLSLNLYYLMTAYAPNVGELGNANAHQLLGEAMRVFAEFPIVPELHLAGDLTQSREEIKIMHNGLDMEELSQVWSTFSQPFRLSVLYEVSVVQLDMSATKRPMAQRVRQVGVPGAGTAYRPPVVEGVEPTGGPAGVAVTFRGAHLSGWKAFVRVLRQEIVSGLEIAGDSFQATLPVDLAAGFYELRVDVSNLFRRNFLFEVTAVNAEPPPGG